ncbi:hypothetical protein Y1Q_0003125 [Alligator mississippiensis]|uniref:Uncharacterized protein n=1 Tax=Alligator mississippiensis TaxID=8496 RepID=A0A151MDN0_ALLMI|nr:hypothetical protein Y1Q_0003125 [Alligator mississippiensis]
MHQLRQRKTQDLALLLDNLVTASEEQIVNSQAWQVEDVTWQEALQVEDIAHKDARDLYKEERDQCKEERDQQRDQVDQEFRDRLLALEERRVEALVQQAVLVARAVKVMEEDCQVLATVLALAVTFMLPSP